MKQKLEKILILTLINIQISFADNTVLSNVNGGKEAVPVMHNEAPLSGVTVIPLDDEIKQTLLAVRRRARGFGSFDEEIAFPKTIEDAAAIIRTHVRPDFVPTKAVEENGVFYFSGHFGSEDVDDFRFGYYVQNSSRWVNSWDMNAHPIVNDPIRFIPMNDKFVEKIENANAQMQFRRYLRDRFAPPLTVEEAIRALDGSVYMPSAPTVTEHEGVFYFFGGHHAKPVDIFDSGFAITKGRREIYEWQRFDDPEFMTGLLSRLRIRPWDGEIAARIESAKPRLRVRREVENLFDPPQTIQEAVVFLRKHLDEHYEHAIGAEHEDVFYFSGDTTNRKEPLFSFGYAIRKGHRTIFEWNYVEEEEMNEDGND